jgi:hypothetical protein
MGRLRQALHIPDKLGSTSCPRVLQLEPTQPTDFEALEMPRWHVSPRHLGTRYRLATGEIEAGRGS